ncbi:glycosyltransferase family 2 protein [Planctomycetota bacterium]
MRSPVRPLEPGISVVVPAFNSEQSLGELIERLEPVLRESTSEEESFEVLLVNDGSADETWRVIGELARRHPWIRGIDLMRNYGQHNALLCGLRAARYRVTVTMDDDLQHPPEELPKLLDRLGGDCDVVYGAPITHPHGLLRNLLSLTTKIALQKAMGAESARNISAWRTLRTRLREGFDRYRGAFVSLDVLLTWTTSRFAVVRVQHDPRTVGRSNYTLSKLVTHALNMMTGFTTLPLRLASWIGFLFTLFGLMTLFYVVGRYAIEGGSVPGFPFLACIISIFSGATLFSLGIIGEYVARMHVRVMDRPAYMVRSTCVQNSDD